MSDRPFRFAAMAAGATSELLRRRDEIGVSYVSVNTAFCEQFAPVVELLAGQ
jgi:hypothetical protein